MARTKIAEVVVGHRVVVGTEWPIVDVVERDATPGRRPVWVLSIGRCQGVPVEARTYRTRRAALAALGAPLGAPLGHEATATYDQINELREAALTRGDLVTARVCDLAIDGEIAWSAVSALPREARSRLCAMSRDEALAECDRKIAEVAS